MIKWLLRTEPVRIYSVLVAVVALVGYFAPSGAWPLVTAVLAATLGQQVRNRVWSGESHERTMEQLVSVTSTIPDPVAGNLLPEDD